MNSPGAHELSLRTAVKCVALANFGYFFVEFGVARYIGSVSWNAAHREQHARS
jgi:hypothetical protein